MRKGGVFFLALSFALWSALWFFAAGEMKKQAALLIAQAEESDITVATRGLFVRNYPFIPEVAFSGRIGAYGHTADIPLLLVRGFFLPGKKIRIQAPDGLSVLAPADPALWSAEGVSFDLIVPPSLPAAFTREDMQTWKESGGGIDIERFEIRKSSLFLSGAGRIALDDSLQPECRIAARAEGHQAFLEWLLQNGYVGSKEALLSGAVLAGLSKTDPDDGRIFIDVSLTIQNRVMFVNALRLFEVPEILWPWRR